MLQGVSKLCLTLFPSPLDFRTLDGLISSPAGHHFASRLVELKVKDHSHSGKDHHLGSFAVRVADMQQGYRRAYLQDYTGKVLKPASLFLRIEKKFQKVTKSD